MKRACVTRERERKDAESVHEKRDCYMEKLMCTWCGSHAEGERRWDEGDRVKAHEHMIVWEKADC